MKHTECEDCELREGDCGHHFKADGKTNYDIASLSACDKYGNCMFFKSKAEPKGDLISRSELKKAIEPYRYAICGFEGVLALIDNAPTVKTFIDKISEISTPDGRTSIVAKNLTKEEEWLFFKLVNHNLLNFTGMDGGNEE